MHHPQALGKYNVLLIGEALGEQEADTGVPFSGRAGFLLDKLVRHAGLDRQGFGITNAVSCRPPDNKLSGMPYEQQAVYECRERHLLPLLRSYQTQRPVLVPMGAVALSSLLGRKDIIDARGYVWEHPLGSVYPTVHPSYIMRGNGNYGTVFIHDLQQAVEFGARGFVPAPTYYTLDPTPAEALSWASAYEEALAADPQGVYLAFDIETPYEDELKEDGSLEDEDSTYVILRISFSYRNHHALSIPWHGSYLPAISRLLGSEGPKVVWNASFDCPRIRAHAVAINGPLHDGMVAWHVLESDLPKSLRFVSSMLLPNQPPWKHLAASQPSFLQRHRLRRGTPTDSSHICPPPAGKYVGGL
jgi:uracil-DNA glycosylase family 4